MFLNVNLTSAIKPQSYSPQAGNRYPRINFINICFIIVSSFINKLNSTKSKPIAHRIDMDLLRLN